MDFHVAGAFKLFVNQVVHTATGIYQTSGQDGQAAAFGGITGSAEETFSRMQRGGINTAGKGSAAGRHGQVVSAGQTGNTIQQDNDIHTAFDDTFGSFQGQFRHARVVFDRFIEGGRDDFTFNGTPHIGDLFRTFADKANHQVNIAVIGSNGVGNGFQQHGFTGFRR